MVRFSLLKAIHVVMGRKQNKTDGGGGGVNAVQNRDIMQRMNFLWQASVYLESVGGSSMGGAIREEEEEVLNEGEAEGGEKRRRKKRERKKRADGRDLARMYIQTMKSVGQKTTTKMCVPPAYPHH